MQPGVDIVVVNYRSYADLTAFIAHCEPEIEHTLWIADVDPETPQDWDGVNANIITHEQNVGFARAVNDAVKRGDREVVAIFNADTQLRPGVVETLHAELLTHRMWGAVGPKQVNCLGKITSAGVFGLLNNPEMRGWQRADSDVYSDIRDDAVTVSGSAYFMRREVWDEMTACPLYRESAPDAQGAFLPTPHYYEESACSYHLHAHGYRVVYYGGVSMLHHWHNASPVGGWAERQYPVSRELFRAFCDHHDLAHD